MDEKLIRDRIHRAVDAHGAALREDPLLAQRILLQNQRKEGPRVKKLSTGAIIVIVLMLLSVTALAAVLTVEEIWQQSFDKMGTWGEIWNIGAPAEEDLPLEKATEIARQTLKDNFGVTDEELDAMGFYPTYIEASIDGGTYYPAEWRFFWSSRTNVDIAMDDDDHGPNGEYRVYMDAITGEVDTCIFYVNNFWDYAQRVWDAGNYDEVYREYQQADFYSQPIAQQQYWENLLVEKEYELISAENKNMELLKDVYLELLYLEPNQFLDPAEDAQAAAAWDAVKQVYGYDTDILKRHGFVAVRSDLNTGTDDIFISFNYHVQLYTANMWAENMASDVNRVGTFMVSFQPGTTQLTSTTHMRYTDWNPFVEPVETGLLYAKNDWNSEDLLTYTTAFEQLNRAMKRMTVAGSSASDMETVARHFIRSLGGDPDWYPAAPEDMNVDQWFAEESEWDALIAEPEMSYDEFVAAYGADRRFWPMEVMVALEPGEYRMPNEGETTIDQAIQMALDHLAQEQGVTDLTGYTISCHRVSLTDDPAVVDCRWEVYIADDPANPINGWKIHWGEWEDRVDSPFIQSITDEGNG